MAVNRQEILDLYKGLRVTDVVDGLDAVGLQDILTMTPNIRPLWRDIENFSHCYVGFAKTMRFLPTNKTLRSSSIEDYLEKKNVWYGTIANDAAAHVDVQQGDVLVIDGDIGRDMGYIGSMNGYDHFLNGYVGIVTNGTIRDTDELIKQRVPIHFRDFGRGIRPGRLEFDTHNIPINVGGVMVRPGDLVVADGDGVVVVPIEYVHDVAKIAWDIANGDKEQRAALYKKAGVPLDWTVQV